MIYTTDQINKLREVRKLASIMNSYGPNTLVPGGKIALLRFGDVVNELKTEFNMTEESIEQGINDLEELGYPAK